MRHADTIEFVADESGWEMHITDIQGEVFSFNIHAVAWDLARHASETIGEWRAEGEAVCRERSASAGDDLRSDEDEAVGAPALERLRDSGAADALRDMARGK